MQSLDMHAISSHAISRQKGNMRIKHHSSKRNKCSELVKSKTPHSRPFNNIKKTPNKNGIKTYTYQRHSP
jgi:hypothetical protein